ncbi:unnamed protein product [marine sediment metagenome]|uniref:DNA binding HTH domain-containing protein n=1 Tax=marine sediment metagenome TaxID=412755 RepID=X1CQ96_9ZZZZ
MTNGKVNGHEKAAELMGINPSTLRNLMDKLGVPYGRGKEGERVNETDANVKILGSSPTKLEKNHFLLLRCQLS